MNNSYILIIIIILILMFLSFKNKPKKASFGLTCSKNRSHVSWNGNETCYSVGDYPNLSGKHPRLGDMVISAGENTVQYFGLANFQRLRGTVLPGEVKRFRGWPWSIRVKK